MDAARHTITDLESLPALFASANYSVRELDRAGLPGLQAFFEANPEYFLTVGGRPPAPDEAQTEFDDLPPPHLSYSRRWFCGIFDHDSALAGMTIVLADLVVPAVWHVALFIVATKLHGSGAAHELHAALQDWAQRSGARWLRLGVVVGNLRAERFWLRLGYRELRQRPWGGNEDGRTRQTRVMVKPLTELTLQDYLAQVPRDRPGSTLP